MYFLIKNNKWFLLGHTCFGGFAFLRLSFSYFWLKFEEKIFWSNVLLDFFNHTIYNHTIYLIIIFLPKETILKKGKLTKQRRYKSHQKTKPAFYILHHYSLAVFLILLFNKNRTKRYKYVSQNFFIVFFLINTHPCSSTHTIIKIWFIFQAYLIALGWCKHQPRSNYCK